MSRPRELSQIASAMDVTSSNHVRPLTDNTQTFGDVTHRWSTLYGQATSALYADLAERYESDGEYPVGTVLIIGGSAEVTTTDVVGHPSVAGLVSYEPAFRMNDGEDKMHWPFIALAGRVPARVIGPISKGDRLGTSNTPGVAMSLEGWMIAPGSVIGIAMQSYENELDEGVIEVMVRSA